MAAYQKIQLKAIPVERLRESLSKETPIQGIIGVFKDKIHFFPDQKSVLQRKIRGVNLVELEKILRKLKRVTPIIRIKRCTSEEIEEVMKILAKENFEPKNRERIGHILLSLKVHWKFRRGGELSPETSVI